MASGVLHTKGDWVLGVEGLVAVMFLSWPSGVHGTHSEAFPSLLLWNGREFCMSKGSLLCISKIFD